jgi:hypothetical protein
MGGERAAKAALAQGRANPYNYALFANRSAVPWGTIWRRSTSVQGAEK